MNLNIQLSRKPADFDLSKCLIDKVIVLPQAEFNDLIRRPLNDRGWIIENRDVMYQDEHGKHCLLALGEDCIDGLVIESEGSAYARYAAYLPSASTLVMNEVRQAADFIVSDGTRNTATGNFLTPFEELENALCLKVTPDNGFMEMILHELEAREEVAEVDWCDLGFDTTYYLDHCLNLEEDIDDDLDPEQENEQQM